MKTPKKDLEKLLQDSDIASGVIKTLLDDQHFKVNELIEGQLKYKSLFENCPVSLWEEDFSEVQQFLKKHCPNAELVQTYLDENPEKIIELVSLVKIVDVNQATLKLYKANSKEDLFNNFNKIFTINSLDVFKTLLIKLSSAVYEFETESFNKNLQDEIFHIKLRYSIVAGYEETWERVIVSIIDISQEKEIREQLQQSEQRFIEAQAIAHFGNWHIDYKKNRVTRSKEIYNILDINEDDLKPTFDAFIHLVHKDDLKEYQEVFNTSIKEQKPYELVFRIITPKGKLKFILEKGYTFCDENNEPIRTVGTAQDITEKTLAEIKVKESQIQYQVLFDNAPIALFEEDFTEVIRKLIELGAHENNIHYLLDDQHLLKQCMQLVFVNNVNLEALKLFKAKSKKHFHQLLPELFTNHAINVVKNIFIAITNGQLNGSYETTLKMVDGELFHALVRYSVLKYKKELGKLIFSVENITLRKKLLADIEEQQLNLNQAQQIALIGSFTLNHENNTIVRTDEFYRIFEATPEELPTREECFLSFVKSEDLAELVKTFHDSIKNKVSYEMNYRIITGKGNLKHIHEKGNTYLNDKGEPYKTIGTLQDITEKTLALKKIEEAHNVIINSNSIAIIWENKPTWPIKYVSENIERILGYTSREMTDEIMLFSTIMHPDDLEFSNKEAFSFLNNAEIVDYTLTPYRVYTKNGKIRWISERTNAIRNEKGEAIELRGFMDDITEQYQLENAINAILGSVSKVTGNEYLKEITIQLSQVLEADYTFIGLNEFDNPLIINTLFNCFKGEIVDNFSYNLDGTPCANVLTLEACSYPTNVAHLFPDDLLLKEMEIEGYVGVPLIDSHNNAIGIMVGLFKKPIENTHFAESIIQLFSTRTSAELERLRTEKKLSENELAFNKQLQKLNVAIDAVKDVVFMTNIDGVFTYINNAFTKLYGYKSKEIIGLTTPKILKSGFQTKDIYEHLWNSLLEKKNFYKEIKNKTKDGKLIDIETALSSITNDKGEIIGFVAIQRDITEKIKQNKLLEQSEKKYRDLFDKTKDATLLIKNGLFIDCNESTLKMVKFKGNKEDFLHVHPSQLSPLFQPDGRSSKDKADLMMAIALKKGSHQFEWVHFKATGEEFYAEITLTKVETIEDTIIHCIWRDITEKKIAAQQLKESEEEGWALFENSPNLIWIEDYSKIKLRFNKLRKNGITDLRLYLDENPEELKIFGNLVVVKKVNKRSLEYYEVATQEELLRNITDFFVDESYNGFKEELIHLFNGKLSYSTEVLIKKFNGQLVYLALNITIPETNKELLDKVIVSFNDITEQKRNEKTKEVLLNISKQISTVTHIEIFSAIIKKELNNLLDTSNFYIALYNKEKDTISIPFIEDELDDEFVDYNEFSSEGTLTGYVIKNKKPLLATREVFKNLEKAGVIKLVGSDAQVWLGVPLFIKNEVIGAIAVQSYTNPHAYNKNDLKILEIVSEQIAIAIERIQQQNAIKENEEKFRSIFELSPDMVNLVDINGFILDCNDEFVKQLGYSAKEEILNLNSIYVIAKEDRANAFEKFKTCFIDGQIYNQELNLLRKDGSSFTAEISATINYDENNLPKNIIGIARDITLRKQHELEITNALEKARETDRLKSAFLANMSHEIRTPMNGIIGFAEMLQSHELPAEKRTFYANIIMNSSKQLLSIINDVLDMSTIEAGLVEIKKAPVSINNMLRELHEFFLQRSTEKQLKLNCEPTLNDQLSVINTDQTKVQQVLTNFISNAIKFTKKGSVTFGYTFKDDLLEFYVTDTGIGIDKNLHHEVFERFRQVNMEYTRETIGNGLGLSISKKLVELLGGEIWLTSEPNKGSTFYFTIPYQHCVIDPIEESTTPTTFKTLNEQITILLAEDEEYNRIFIEEILASENFIILEAENGVEAVDIAKEHPEIKFILMDIKMPIMNGIEASKMIKKFNKTVPIIALTAFSMESDKAHLIKEGFDDYVSKPIVKKDLMQLIEKYAHKV